MDMITLTIDGKQVQIEEGGTVLDAARRNGIEIPTLCAHEDLPDFGACRMCIVEIKGMRGYPTSCTTPAAEGMEVRTETEALISLRNQILEFTASGHPNSCLVCIHREDCERYRPRPSKTGQATRCAFCSNRPDCALREMVLDASSNELNLPTLYSEYKIERDDPFMDRDHNLCILCGRCWRICEKIHGTPAISINHRGRWAKIGSAFDQSYVDSGCTFCGACIDICPTGTLTDRFARWYGLPELSWRSTCTICPQGCDLTPSVDGGQVTGTRMTAYDRDARLCAVGRFAYAQVMSATNRLRHPMVRENDELIPTDWEDAIKHVAGALGDLKGDGFLAIIDEANTRENVFVYEAFATGVMNGRVARIASNCVLDDAIADDIRAGRVKSVLTTGDHLDDEILSKIEHLFVMDCLPSKATSEAEAVLPVAILSEVAGSFRDTAGEVKKLSAAVDPPGRARIEWEIIAELAAAMGSDALRYDSVDAVTKAITDDAPPAPLAGSPRDNLKDLPSRYRGHYLADSAAGLKAMGLPSSPKPPPKEITGGFRIIKKYEVVPNFHMLTVEAPAIARHAKPGQFIIVMVNEESERTPFTLLDWDAQAGTITMVVEELGRSSREVADLQEGGVIAHVTGPLGVPIELPEKGTVVLGGGCYGIGAIYPVARALKQSGHEVIIALEACSAHTLYMAHEFRELCDEVIIATKDGSEGTKGGVQELFTSVVERGTKVDLFIAVGCTFMMRMVAETTRTMGIPLQVALNPIMVDGTGMCGACRVSVGEDTKFACVDGPFFDGHAVDWDELGLRREAYSREEVEAMPQYAGGNGTAAALTVTAGCAAKL
ncbi:MAG: sulfide/dihydroorotate dehydrogenase-like FAD/NAD-binding protein [Phycisphaerales bacterium]|nr:sulfide/dihydroorotate dehydrogenase-like FAD/NAD-binding protein [Phycisphaerales bacterium]